MTESVSLQFFKDWDRVSSEQEGRRRSKGRVQASSAVGVRTHAILNSTLALHSFSNKVLEIHHVAKGMQTPVREKPGSQN